MGAKKKALDLNRCHLRTRAFPLGLPLWAGGPKVSHKHTWTREHYNMHKCPQAMGQSHQLTRGSPQVRGSTWYPKKVASFPLWAASSREPVRKPNLLWTDTPKVTSFCTNFNLFFSEKWKKSKDSDKDFLARTVLSSKSSPQDDGSDYKGKNLWRPWKYAVTWLAQRLWWLYIHVWELTEVDI